MHELTQSDPTLFDPAELEVSAAAFCCRFGDPSAEVNRLLTLREVLDASRALTRSLESFTKAATTHFHGVHCTANMNADASSLSRALTHWSEAIMAAANARRDWEERRAVGGRIGAGDGGSVPLADSSRYAHGAMSATPLAPPA
jgi:hypothetical protein